MVKDLAKITNFFIVTLVAVIFCGIINNDSSFALSSQSTTGFQFSFNSSLSMTLSSSDLIISHLTPGNYASSNTITVNVSTNNSYGYTLIAKVGDKNNPVLSNNNLVNANANNDSVFTSLSTSDKITLPNFNDNKWGYTTASSIDTNTTMYSGLLYNADTIINATKNTLGMPQSNEYPGTNITNFTIAAKAGDSQASGEYTNVINFRGVANVSTDIAFEYMQDLSTLGYNEKQELLNFLSEGVAYQLKDSRDDTIYNVAKLKDGNIWLLDNLALDPATLKAGVTLDSTNTNLPAGRTFTLPNSVTAGFDGTATSYTVAAINTASKDDTQPLGVEQSGSGKVGVYYNYCAATAGTYCLASNHTDVNDAIYDICPKGWRMPTGGPSGEYRALRNQYSSDEEFVASFRAPLSGYYDYGARHYQGEGGTFWSSTYSSAVKMYYLLVGQIAAAPQADSDRFFGRSIRCVMDNTYYMQDVTTSDLANMMPSVGDTFTLNDKRDGKDYTVGKMADGKYWMTTNLDLAGETTLTPETSNVATNYTLPDSNEAFLYDYEAYVYNSGSTVCGSGQPCYSYYSYVAATVGTNPSSGNAEYDICPKNWRLPTKVELNTLMTFYDTAAKLTAAPWRGVYAGLYDDSWNYDEDSDEFNYGGTDGYYWSSTADEYNDSFAYELHFYDSNVNVGSSDKGYGHSVRCIAK